MEAKLEESADCNQIVFQKDKIKKKNQIDSFF